MTPALRQVSTTASPAQVAELAARVAREAAGHVRTRLDALRALAPHWPATATGNDPRAAGRRTVAALGAWARTIQLVREPARVGELIAAPWRTAAYRAGDCDDLAAAVAAFAAVVGFPAAVAVYPTAAGFAHAVAVVGDDWTTPHRLTHVIDHDGARPAPPTLLQRAVIAPVSGGG